MTADTNHLDAVIIYPNKEKITFYMTFQTAFIFSFLCMHPESFLKSFTVSQPPQHVRQFSHLLHIVADSPDIFLCFGRIQYLFRHSIIKDFNNSSFEELSSLPA